MLLKPATAEPSPEQTCNKEEDTAAYGRQQRRKGIQKIKKAAEESAVMLQATLKTQSSVRLPPCFTGREGRRLSAGSFCTTDVTNDRRKTGEKGRGRNRMQQSLQTATARRRRESSAAGREPRASPAPVRPAHGQTINPAALP